MSEWTSVWRYRAPTDPDYGGAPTVLTLWLDNLGGLVLGIDQGDGEKVSLMPLPYASAQNLGVALQANHRCHESMTGNVHDDCVRARGHEGAHRTSDGRGFMR